MRLPSVHGAAVPNPPHRGRFACLWGSNRAVRASILVAGTLIAVATAGCTGKSGQSPNAQSNERQSETEYDLARDLFAKQNPRAALDHAMKAISLNEENEKALYFVAVIHLSFCSSNRKFESPDCRLAEAEKYARASLKVAPKFRDAQNLLGTILINEKRAKEAIAILEPLTRDAAYVQPFFAWGNLGWAQSEAGQTDEAIKSLKNAVTLEPRFCVGHFRLGEAFEKKGDFASAEGTLTTAVTVPDQPECANLQDAWWARCRVRLHLNKSQEARQDCEKCREISAETATGKLCVQKLVSMTGALPPPVAPAPSAPASATEPASTNPKRTTT